MKKHILPVAGLFALLVSVPQFAGAVPQASNGSAATASMPTPDEVVARLDSKLSLSADQKTKIKPIIADRQQKLKALAADQSMRRLKKEREMKSIFNDSDARIKALLTDEQKQKYTEIEEQMREQVKERRQQQKDNTSSQ